MNKIIEFEEEKEKQEKKHINKKKVIFAICICIIILFFIIISVLYKSNIKSRNFIDKYIFRKDVFEEKAPYIEIDYNSNTSIIPYQKNISILKENQLTEYNSNGKKENEIKLEINNPIYDTNGKYLVIGEKDSQKFYLISNSQIVWKKEIDGKISRINVNKNGYVSVIVSGTSYKSVIIVYNDKGDELFKTYLSQTIASDSAISNDNNYLAYAELNISGSTIQSCIKVISIKDVKELNTEPKYLYKAEKNDIILRIKYQDKNKLVAMYDNSVHLYDGEIDTKIMDLKENGNKITFGDINLKNHICRLKEETTGLFSANTIIQIVNILNEKQTEYVIEGIVKGIETNENIIAANLGTEVDFINVNGWLQKKYISNQEVRDIVLGDGVAAIIYRDKIELINL